MCQRRAANRGRSLPNTRDRSGPFILPPIAFSLLFLLCGLWSTPVFSTETTIHCKYIYPALSSSRYQEKKLVSVQIKLDIFIFPNKTEELPAIVTPFKIYPSIWRLMISITIKSDDNFKAQNKAKMVNENVVGDLPYRCNRCCCFRYAGRSSARVFSGVQQFFRWGCAPFPSKIRRPAHPIATRHLTHDCQRHHCCSRSRGCQCRPTSDWYRQNRRDANVLTCWQWDATR